MLLNDPVSQSLRMSPLQAPGLIQRLPCWFAVPAWLGDKHSQLAACHRNTKYLHTEPLFVPCWRLQRGPAKGKVLAKVAVGTLVCVSCSLSLEAFCWHPTLRLQARQGGTDQTGCVTLF